MQKMRHPARCSIPPALVSLVKPRHDPVAAESALSWHKRFGHVSMRVIKRLFENKSTSGLPDKFEDAPFTCTDCLLSKSLRTQTLGPSGGKQPQPLKLIVSDVAGPFDGTLKGSKYMEILWDVATTYLEVVVVKGRGAVPKEFQEFVARMERPTPYRVKTLRTNGAGEFTSNTFINWCRARGIDKDKTMPYEHNQNGITEHVIRTINDKARTMRIGAQLPEKFRVVAGLTAGYIHNRVPNVNTGSKTPMELLFGKKPHLKCLSVFGEEAFVHIPSERGGKLEAWAQRCLFVGYIPGSKVWRFYNPDTNKVVESLMAVFLSDKPPIANTRIDAREPSKGNL